MTDVVISRATGRAPRYMPILAGFITTRCNLRCRMCGVCDYSATDEMPELSTDQWLRVVDSGVHLGMMLFSIGGGEPMLRPDLYQIIRRARDQGVSVHLCTNGLLLNSENVARLRESKVNTVSVSIESPVAEVHESLRGKGTYEPAVEGIRRLRAEAPDIHVGINMVITALSFRTMADAVPFAEALGVHQIKFAPVHMNLLHKRKPPEEFRDLVFGPRDLDALEVEVQRLRQALRRSRLQTNSTSFLNGITSLYRNRLHFRCYAGYAIGAVDPSGRVLPCCDMDGVLNVRDQSLEKIWRSKEFDEMRRRVCSCSRPCWDTTNTELSIRLSPTSWLRDLPQTWRDILFYFDCGK